MRVHIQQINLKQVPRKAETHQCSFCVVLGKDTFLCALKILKLKNSAGRKTDITLIVHGEKRFA